MLDWCIWYTDGSTYSSDDGSPESAPARGVLIILQATPDEGWIPLMEKDNYWFDPRTHEWMCGNDFGLYDFLIEHTSVKFGRSMRTPDWQQLKRRVLKEHPGFPPKSTINYPREGTDA